MQPSRTALALPAIVVVGVLLMPIPGLAQTIRGTVIEANRRPIADAEVLLRGADEKVMARAVSDDAGRFVLAAESGGVMHLEASHLGHAEWSTDDFELTAEDDLTVEIRLNVSAIPLDPVTVEARSRRSTRRLADFERRMENPAFGGYFLTEEDIARRPMSRPSNLVLEAPGMTVAGGAGAFDRYTIYSGDCPATVYVDGVRIEQTNRSVDDYLELDRIGGVEVYPRAMRVPLQYQDALMRDCGVVLYWTKELEPDREGGWSATKVSVGVVLLTGLLALGLVL